ncbi:hypothetical protein PQR66_07610 [Paraburkholderia agricolaris]|uniref:Core-binding (CB) domain-containing protein n=1 Tax=Paraburkholderia agricolaris TaxID=2152888 RepID=A0ABW8ZL49_9BURK
MVALLGPEARFPANEKNIDLIAWLDRGIDPWVWSTVACFRAMLLSGARKTATVTQYSKSIRVFFAYLTGGRQAPRIAGPVSLSPIHIDAFIDWLRLRGKQLGHTPESTRTVFKNVKSVLWEMFAQGYIPGEPTRFFKRKAVCSGSDESRQTSLSDAEQERLANAIKLDLVAIHHGKLHLSPKDVQALRLLVVAHRQGTPPTPLLELCRDTLAPGLMPGTVRMRTSKVRGRRIRSGAGRAASDKPNSAPKSSEQTDDEVFFSLAEGAVLQQAIASTDELAKAAPARYRNRVWLYRSQQNGAARRGAVTCLTTRTLATAIASLIKRHSLLADNGKPLRLNLSRTRKSYFDRAFRKTDGDLTKTANLMGNTARVAGRNYPSMNEARKGEAAKFMDEYVDLMRTGLGPSNEVRVPPRLIKVEPIGTAPDGSLFQPPERTPVSGCKDTLNGEYAPHDGHTHCDRYVMCLFCTSFAVIGSVDELWRLFSFQTFAKSELDYLDANLGPERTKDEDLEDLRDRYRVAIPFIDQFTQRQFPASVVKKARAKTQVGLHPFWIHQMNTSRRARASFF